VHGSTPKGDPRLKRSPSGPKVTTDYVDPCIVFLESKLRDQTPFIAALLAHSSHETRDLPGRPYLELQEIVAVEWTPLKGNWPPKQSILSKCRIVADGTHLLIDSGKLRFVPCPLGQRYLSEFGSQKQFSGAIKFLSRAEMISLRSLLPRLHGDPLIPFGHACLALSNLDSPSISEALAWMKRREVPKQGKKIGIFRRILSSLFSKKLASHFGLG